MKIKREYKPDYAALYPGVAISNEVMEVLIKSDRKMRHMESEIKNDVFIYNSEEKIAMFLPSREDSYERLCDEENAEFETNNLSPEDVLVHSDELERLQIALQVLNRTEQELIEARFYEGLSEREYAQRIGISQKAVNKRWHKISAKLKNLMEN